MATKRHKKHKRVSPQKEGERERATQNSRSCSFRNRAAVVVGAEGEIEDLDFFLLIVYLAGNSIGGLGPKSEICGEHIVSFVGVAVCRGKRASEGKGSFEGFAGFIFPPAQLHGVDFLN